jgi:hypothetical protein
MSSLREAQRAFAAALLSAAPAEGGLQLHRNNVFIGLSGALGDVYPVVRRLVGEAFFNQLARRFIRQYPSRSANLHDFGRDLPGFLAGLAETAELAYLPDVAALEWACQEVLHAADAAPLVFTAASDPERIQWRLHPAVRLVASRYPVAAIWEANQLDEPPLVDLAAGADWLFVQRRGLERRVARLSAGEFALLSALDHGLALAEACEAAVAAQANVDLAAAMARFVTELIFAEESSC